MVPRGGLIGRKADLDGEAARRASHRDVASLSNHAVVRFPASLGKTSKRMDEFES